MTLFIKKPSDHRIPTISTIESQEKFSNDLYKLTTHLYDNHSIALGRFGVVDDINKQFTKQEIEERVETLINAFNIIPFLIIKTSRKGLTGSYGLKHIIEKFLTGIPYLSNGECILLMIALDIGFHFQKDPYNPNITFCVKYTSSLALDNKGLIV
jgi:hypothetical protein